MVVITLRLNNNQEIEQVGKVLKWKRSEVIRNLLEQGRKMKALELFKQRKVSLGLAAQITGITLKKIIYKILLNIFSLISFILSRLFILNFSSP